MLKQILKIKIEAIILNNENKTFFLGLRSDGVVFLIYYFPEQREKKLHNFLKVLF